MQSIMANIVVVGVILFAISLVAGWVLCACHLAGEADDQTELMLGQMDGRDRLDTLE